MKNAAVIDATYFPILHTTAAITAAVKAWFINKCANQSLERTTWVLTYDRTYSSNFSKVLKSVTELERQFHNVSDH